MLQFNKHNNPLAKSDYVANQHITIKCVICLDNNKNIVVKPCNHVVMCENCLNSDKKKFIGQFCPLCRKQIVLTEKIYL